MYMQHTAKKILNQRLYNCTCLAWKQRCWQHTMYIHILGTIPLLCPKLPNFMDRVGWGGDFRLPALLCLMIISSNNYTIYVYPPTIKRSHTQECVHSEYLHV